MTTNAGLDDLGLNEYEKTAFWSDIFEQSALTKADNSNRASLIGNIDAGIAALDAILANPLPNDVTQHSTLAGILRKILLYHRKEIIG